MAPAAGEPAADPSRGEGGEGGGGDGEAPDRLLRLPFDLYARCRLAVDATERVRTARGGARALEVLDVGGGPHSIHAFLPGDDVVTVDRSPPPAEWYALPSRFALADGGALPFADGAFDVVVSLDTLEHVPPAWRERLLGELLRVTRGWAVVACPCATDGVADADAAVLSVVERRFGEAFPTVAVLREHLGYGHPEPAAVRGALERGGAVVAQVPSGRLDRWLPMTLVFYSLLALDDDEPVERVQAWYNARFTVDDRRAPAYRQAFLARRGDAAGPEPAEVAAALTPPEAAPRSPAPEPPDAALAAVRAVLEHPLVDLAEARRRRIEELEAAVAGAGEPAGDEGGGHGESGPRAGAGVGVLRRRGIRARRTVTRLPAPLRRLARSVRHQRARLAPRRRRVAGRGGPR